MLQYSYTFMNQPRDWTAEFDYLNRFFSYVKISRRGCWEWQGGHNKAGYGQFRQGNRNFKAHRWAWEVLRSPLPPNITLHHTCFNRPCVNPSHLQLMTQSDNSKIKRGHRCPKCGYRTRAKNVLFLAPLDKQVIGNHGTIGFDL